MEFRRLSWVGARRVLKSDMDAWCESCRKPCLLLQLHLVRLLPDVVPQEMASPALALSIVAKYP